MPRQETLLERELASRGEPLVDEFPAKVKEIIPSSKELSEILDQGRGSYPGRIDCWKCSNPLRLSELSYDWPIGQYTFSFDIVPGYRCKPCDVTYFPETVRLAMTWWINRKLSTLPKELPKQGPLTLEYRRLYGRP